MRSYCMCCTCMPLSRPGACMQAALQAGGAVGAPVDTGIGSAALLVDVEDGMGDSALGGGRRLSESFVRRTSGVLSNSATAESGATAAHESKGATKIVTRSVFVRRTPVADEGADGEFAAPFVEETVVKLAADDDGVDESSKRTTRTRSPVPKGDSNKKPRRGVDFPRVPDDVNKAKSTKKAPAPKAPKVAKEVVSIVKAPPRAPPQPRVDRPKKVKAPTTRTRPRSKTRRSREAGLKPPSSGGRREKKQKPAPPPPPPPPPPSKGTAKVGKRSRGDTRFLSFTAKAKGRDTIGKTRFGFTSQK